MPTGRRHVSTRFSRRFAPDWQELRESYLRFTICLALNISFLADLTLISKRIEFGRD